MNDRNTNIMDSELSISNSNRLRNSNGMKSQANLFPFQVLCVDWRTQHSIDNAHQLGGYTQIAFYHYNYYMFVCYRFLKYCSQNYFSADDLRHFESELFLFKY